MVKNAGCFDRKKGGTECEEKDSTEFHKTLVCKVHCFSGGEKYFPLENYGESPILKELGGLWNTTYEKLQELTTIGEVNCFRPGAKQRIKCHYVTI